MSQIPDEVRGLYQKWSVRRLGDAAGKHAACDTFVLDADHDPFARAALDAYADACAARFPALAADLRAKMDRIAQRASSPSRPCSP